MHRQDQESIPLTVSRILCAAPIEEAEAVAPETTVSERRLHGDLAGVVQLLRDASFATATAYALVRRKRRALPAGTDRVRKLQAAALDQTLEQAWKAKSETRLAFQDVAAVPPRLFKGSSPD